MRLVTVPARVGIGGALAGAIAAWLASSVPLSAVADGAARRVVIERFAFRPATLWIRPGETVFWGNRDIVPHTATAASGGWDTKTLEQGETVGIAFPVAGRFDYVCRHHPGMRATIIVSAE